MDDFDGGFIPSSAKHDYTGIKTIRCLTIKQIQNTSIDESTSLLIIDNFEVSNVQLCGYVVSLKKISSGLIFELEDTTAKIECAFWTNGSFEELTAEQIKENALLKVTGSIKTFGGKKSLNVSSITTVQTDYLIFHLTSCLYQHLYFTHKLTRKEEKKINTLLPKMQSEILEIYKNNQDDNGLDLEVVVSMLKGKYSENDIRNNVESLLNNCHLYSVDGSCYKTTI